MTFSAIYESYVPKDLHGYFRFLSPLVLTNCLLTFVEIRQSYVCKSVNSLRKANTRPIRF